MLKNLRIVALIATAFMMGACATAYKAQPLPLRAPGSYANAVGVDGCTIAAEAFDDAKKAQDAFGFDVRGAGLLPVQVVFDNQGTYTFKINAKQTFLEDQKGNLWPILDERTAYERSTRYAQTNKIFSEGAYSGFLGATAGAVIGAAIGIVSGENIGQAIGMGAAVGGAAGATIGGVKGAGESHEARRTIINDLNRKSLENKDISGGLAYGFLFFPGEAESAAGLRLQLIETGSNRTYVLSLGLKPWNSATSSAVQISPGRGPVPVPPAAVTPPPPASPNDAGIGAAPAAPPIADDRGNCRQWQMVEKRMVTRINPTTGRYMEVPQEKWDWVEVPCPQGATGADG